ncbi:MAG: hemerythrin family protein [Candidatus Accumulibacter sp.]|nr:hemerythrin family protein [Accumulibacter sp.]
MENHTTDILPQALLIGIPSIDAQHENIFRRIESLKESCYGSGPDSLDEFVSLLNYLEFHFATEEALASTLGVDFLDHSTVHRSNLQSLHKAFDGIRSGARDVHSFLRYAEYWFERHIAEEDKPFAASVHARQQQILTTATGSLVETDTTAND